MDIEGKVLNILEEICFTDEIKLDKNINLFDMQLLDSLATIELIISIKDQIGVELSPSDILRIDIETPNKIIELVNKKIVEKLSKTNEYQEIFLPSHAKNGSIFIQDMFLKEKKILSIYGSSEFTGERDEFYPTRFFNENKEESDIIVNLTGAGYYQSIIHALNFAAIGEKLRNRKIIFVVSFQWFTREGLRPSQFGMVFSELMFYSFMFNSDIDKSLKDYAVKRTEYLSSEDEKLNDLNEFCRLYLNEDIQNKNFDVYKDKYRVLLEEDNETFQMYKNILESQKDVEEKKNMKEYDWKNEKSKAEEVGRGKVTNNKFGIEDEYFNSYIRNTLEESNNKFKDYDYSNSPEYEDFEYLLKICKNVEVDPLFMIIPVNGKWYDYCGFNVNDRIIHYNKIIDKIKLYEFSYSDLTSHEYEDYFLKDIMHLGWKGWVHFNEAIYNFKMVNNLSSE